MSRLYVGNLAHETTEADLRAAFSQFGEVVSAKVMTNRRGRTKEFAYIEMADEASARAAMESLRGTQIKGRILDIVQDAPSGQRRDRHSDRGGRRRR